MAEREPFYVMPKKELPQTEFMEVVVKNNSICLRDRQDLVSLQEVIRRSTSK